MNRPNEPFAPYPAGQGFDPSQPRVAKRGFNPLIIPVVLLTLLLLGSLGFAFWAYAGRQDFKNNVDEKSAAAVAVAVKQESTRKDNEFVEREKNPLKTYEGPETFGSLKLQYPKTWSAYVEQVDNGNVPINGYFHPSFVPDVKGDTAFALRVEVASRVYAEELAQFASAVQNKEVTITAYRLPKVNSVVGSKITGELRDGKQGVMVMLPLRDKTLKVYTESEKFVGDLNKIILANLTFIP